MRKTIITGVIFIMLVLMVIGIWRCFSHQSSYKKTAYEHCLKMVEGDNSEQLNAYCSCIVNVPEGILDAAKSEEWWDGYVTGEGEAKFIDNDELNHKMTVCLRDYAPYNTWIMLGLRWCMQMKGEDEFVCGCVLDEFYNVGGPESLKGFVGSQLGLFTLPEGAKETEQFKNSIEQLFNYCRKHPLKVPEK